MSEQEIKRKIWEFMMKLAKGEPLEVEEHLIITETLDSSAPSVPNPNYVIRPLKEEKGRKIIYIPILGE